MNVQNDQHREVIFCKDEVFSPEFIVVLFLITVINLCFMSNE